MTMRRATEWATRGGLLCVLPVALWSQSLDRNCGMSSHALHATLNAQRNFYGESRLEQLTFRLMNDSDETLTSAVKTWTLVIDGKEVANSGMMFGNGPGPIDGYEKVPSGTTLEFGKELPLNEYFSENRDYKVYWRSAAFQSNTVTVRGGTVDR